MVTASYTLGQVEATTRPQILRALLRETDLGLYGTTTAAVSTTVMEDTTKLANAYPDDHFNDKWVYVLTGTGSGQILRISDFVSSTGRLTHQTATQVGSGATYGLFHNIHPQDVLDLLDDVMTQETFWGDYGVLTEVVDGDMEQNNLTDWTDTSATSTKVTTEPAMNGKRWLRVANSGANGRTRSALMSVPMVARSYHVSALVRCAAGTAQLIVYDETNGAALKTLTTTSKGVVRLNGTFQTLATTQQISLRLGGSESNADTYWDDAILYAEESHELPLPFWVKDRSQVRQFYRMLPQVAGTSAEWMADMTGMEDPRWLVKQSRFGRGQLVAENVARNSINEPVYFFGLRNETAWTSDTEVKHVDQQLVVNALAAKCYARLYNTAQMVGAERAHYESNLNRWEAKRRDRQKAMAETEDELNTPVRRMVAVGRRRYGSPYWGDRSVR